MHLVIGLLLIALLLLGCRVLWYAAICMRPRVQELREMRRAERRQRKLERWEIRYAEQRRRNEEREEYPGSEAQRYAERLAQAEGYRRVCERQQAEQLARRQQRRLKMDIWLKDTRVLYVCAALPILVMLVFKLAGF
jgi:hypothetical protein